MASIAGIPWDRPSKRRLFITPQRRLQPNITEVHRLSAGFAIPVKPPAFAGFGPVLRRGAHLFLHPPARISHSAQQGLPATPYGIFLAATLPFPPSAPSRGRGREPRCLSRKGAGDESWMTTPFESCWPRPGGAGPATERSGAASRSDCGATCKRSDALPWKPIGDEFGRIPRSAEIFAVASPFPSAAFSGIGECGRSWKADFFPTLFGAIPMGFGSGLPGAPGGKRPTPSRQYGNGSPRRGPP